MVQADTLLSFLDQILVLPRQLLLDTPGVRATVPMLRGVWGAALHGLHPAAYQSVFAPDGDAGTPGYLLRPAPPDPATAPSVQWFLFGAALAHDEVLRRAWDVASGMGLGPQRRRFTVRAWLPLGPDGRPAAPATPWPLAAATWPLPEPPATAPCRLRIPAPLRLLRQGRLIERPALPDLAVAAWRRLRAFLPPSSRPEWDQLKADLLAEARRPHPGVWHGTRLDLQRWSASQQAELDLRGVAGVLDLPDGPGELWPLLNAATWLHVGKGTVLGLGQVLIEPWPA